ncbi:PREDICTED: proline-rich membrane anchor 1, partial [Corvus brachyrhynchos]|uniref:proline-rich membrane anchor 1 n=1 Tax=Corvus brachyrhynchos TaxID=85066 RepID=UPI000816494D
SQITQGEPQKSCSKPVAEKFTESCQEICQCRPPPLLPPPPPPPPPPRLLAVPTPKSTFCPTEETWWPGLVIIIAVCCATLVFLFVVVIICYKAIKRSKGAMQLEEGELHQISKTEKHPVYTVLPNAAGLKQANACMVERSLWTLRHHFRRVLSCTELHGQSFIHRCLA